MHIHLHHDFWNVSDFDQIAQSKEEEEERRKTIQRFC